MKKIIISITLFSMLSVFTGCAKFLDVQPEDRMIQEQVKENELAIYSLLNGIYMRMADNSMYGHYLTMSIVECLAQRFSNTNDNMPYYHITRGAFFHERGQNALASIWEALYVQCLGINDLLIVLDETTLPIATSRMSMLRAEALALRAFYHFDILRLWGPRFGDQNAFNNEAFMPYNTSAIGEILPFLTADSVIKRIMEDLNEASELLRQFDPIITRGIVTEITFDPRQDFFLNRNYRMNYYAVMATKARVYQWIEQHENAYLAAKTILDAPRVVNGTLFPWVEPRRVSAEFNPDRLFSPEIIFGIHSRNMYSNFDGLFAPQLSVTSELTPLQHRTGNRLHTTFASQATGNLPDESDMRYIHLWRIAGGDKGDQKAFMKYSRPTRRGDPLNPIFGEFFQPLIRISEMYYIAAESYARWHNTPAAAQEAAKYLNTVMERRGLRPLTNIQTLEDLNRGIYREYEKEFFGEGQLFYYLKRHNINEVPHPSTPQVTTTIALRFPIPLKELEARVQTDNE